MGIEKREMGFGCDFIGIDLGRFGETFHSKWVLDITLGVKRSLYTSFRGSFGHIVITA